MQSTPSIHRIDLHHFRDFIYKYMNNTNSNMTVNVEKVNDDVSISLTKKIWIIKKTIIITCVDDAKCLNNESIRELEIYRDRFVSVTVIKRCFHKRYTIIRAINKQSETLSTGSKVNKFPIVISKLREYRYISSLAPTYSVKKNGKIDPQWSDILFYLCNPNIHKICFAME